MDIYFEDSKIAEITSEPRDVSFSFYSSNDIVNLSATEVICPVFFDYKGKSIKWGLCDMKLGTLSKYESCISCSGSYSICPGHFGHIELAIPVVNPLIKNIFNSILNAKCWYCSYFKIASWKIRLFYIKLLMLDLGLYIKGFRMKLTEFLFSNLNTGLNLKYTIKIINLITEKIEINWFQSNSIYYNLIKNNNRGFCWNKFVHFFLEKSSLTNYC